MLATATSVAADGSPLRKGGRIAAGDLADLMLVPVPSGDTDLTDPGDLLGCQSSRSPCDQSNRRGWFHERSQRWTSA